MLAFAHQNLNPNVLATQYAVRGALVLKANEIDKEIKAAKARGEASPYPFDKVVYCNIGNPQICNQQPLTYIRQVVSLVDYPALFEHPELFPADVIAHAKAIAGSTGCIGTTGAYSHSMGLPFVRQSVAHFIEKRDGLPTSPEDIFLTDGASSGIKIIINMIISHARHGIMIPIPQYPLYSASITQYGGTFVPYYLDEDNNWNIDMASVRDEYRRAVNAGILVKGFAVINPGNPTGVILSLQNMQEILEFCYEKKLCLLADEVYQDNIYGSIPFTSFRKLLATMDPKVRDAVELVSFFSISKGFYGECGKRGGYLHLTNINDFARQQLYKLVSVSLCSNVIGQEVLELVVNPPQPGDESFPLYQKERDTIVDSLARKAKALHRGLTECEGVTCSEAEGALYLFPRVRFPQRFLDECYEREQEPDDVYCMEMLLSTGVCVVPGTGFGQREGTYHYRIAFLPPEDEIGPVVRLIKAFHTAFMARYR